MPKPGGRGIPIDHPKNGPIREHRRKQAEALVDNGKRRSKKPASALGKLDRSGRAHPLGPLTTANAFTVAGAVPKRQKTKAPRLSAADRKALAKAQAAKRPSKAQKELLQAAAVRKAAGNAKRSNTLKASNARRRKLAQVTKGATVGMFTPKGPRQ